MLFEGPSLLGFGTCSGAGGGADGVPGTAELLTTSFSSLLGLK